MEQTFLLKENGAQEEAVHTIKGPLLIISCPGSGKTTTLIRRIHYMIENGIRPGHILMVTFTNAAAREMQEKYLAFYGQNPGITFQTIHSLCFNLLRREGRVRTEDLSPDEGSVNFDGMLTDCLAMLKESPGVLKKWRGIFQYIQCDEYQDTSPVQRDILYLLAGKDGNLCVVGDDDQSIYHFRGADPSVMMDFPKDFRTAKIIRMGINYRSGLSIVQISRRVIERNHDRFPKQFQSYRGKNDSFYGRVIYQRYHSRKEEIGGVISLIRRLKGEGIPFREMAVLFRTNQQADLPAMMLRREGIPFQTDHMPRDDGGDTPGVALMTIHKAKGMEWKAVFIIDVNAGLIPLRAGRGVLSEREELEEERRLFYVALTRAEDILYLMNSSKKESLFMREIMGKR